MNKKTNRENRRGGFYFDTDGKAYASVTTILSIIDKPALRYWFGKEVYLAMVKDPSLNEQSALSAPYQKGETAKTRGTTVHSIVEAYKNTKEYIESVPPEFAGYAKAFYNWVKDNDIEIVIHEKTVISRKHGYAGTLDLLVKNKQSNKMFIIDVKTGKDIYAEAFLQLSAYKQALSEEGVEVDHIAVLLLNEEGTYKFGQGDFDLDSFLACKKLWEWKNKDLIEKLKV